MAPSPKGLFRACIKDRHLGVPHRTSETFHQSPSPGLGDERAHPYDARMALRSALTRIEIGPIDSAGATTATRLLDSEGTAQPGHVEVYAYRSAIQEVYNKI